MLRFMLVPKLLGAVLAEHPDAGFEGLPDLFGRLRLGCRHQRHRRRIAPGAHGCLRDVFLYAAYVFRNALHQAMTFLFSRFLPLTMISSNTSRFEVLDGSLWTI